MSATRRFSPRRRRERAARMQELKDLDKRQRRASRASAFVAAEYQRRLEREAEHADMMREVYTIGFLLAWLRSFALVPGVLEITDTGCDD